MRTPLTLCGALILLAGCADADPPTFAAEATLAVDTESDRVSFEWPAASDDRAVNGYLVRIDGEPAARLGPDARSYGADELAEATEHRVEVVAIDAAGNESSALEVTVATPDRTAPTFPEGARPSVSAEGEAGDALRAVTLSWPAAEDAVGVARYRVLRGAEEVGTTEGTSLRLEDVALTDATELSVRALDAAGNESSGIALHWADVPQRRQEQAAVDRRLEVERQSAQVQQLLLGALANDRGALADVLASPDLSSDVEDVMATSRGVGVARGGGLRGGGLGGGGSGADIGELHSAGGGTLTGLTAVSPRPRGRVVITVSGGAETDRELLDRMVRLRRGALLACYERALQTDSQLTGAVDVELELSAEGAVTSAAVREDTLPRSDVGLCAQRVLRRLPATAGPGTRHVRVAYTPIPTH